MEILKQPLHVLVAMIKKGDLKARDVTEAFLSQAKKLNPKVNAFITWNDRAPEEAAKVDAAIAAKASLGPLAGVPIAIKDMLCTRGIRTTAASKILDNFIPPYSATVVERLSAAGAIVLGKTNQDEFAMGSSTENSAYGITRNPWNLEFVPGGSSGGSAAACAALMAPAAIGTDTGGSIRQPASFCGIAGIKPTYGRVSRYGIIAFASSLDQAGPMARNVRDCALILETIAGHDERDSTTSKKEIPAWSQKMTDDLRGLKIGKPKEYFAEGLDPEVGAIVNKAIEVLKSRGAEIVDVSLPMTKHAISVYYLVATSEASSNLARYDGVRYGVRAPAADIESLYRNSRGLGFGPEVKRRIMLGTYALSSGYYDAYYKKACQVRRMMQNDFLNAFTKCDLLISPVTANPPFKIGGQIKDPLAMYLNDIYTTSTNLAGLPGMSVPGGWTKSGLPIGVQLTAKHFDEQTIFNAGLAIERHLGLEERFPNVQ
ncbi:MAG: Asp-tRNA(Asn)/Glu-tRNA(Gln) amidotransferase subunit GatA [Bdellovibrionia bacterium]